MISASEASNSYWIDPDAMQSFTELRLKPDTLEQYRFPHGTNKAPEGVSESYATLHLILPREVVTEVLKEKPQTIEEKLMLGRERSLIYKTLAWTGLRRGELAAVEIRNLFLDDPKPYIKLDRKSEENREGNTLPLRSDLADDLRAWIHDKVEG